jgi:hypothetical protein
MGRKSRALEVGHCTTTGLLLYCVMLSVLFIIIASVGTRWSQEAAKCVETAIVNMLLPECTEKRKKMYYTGPIMTGSLFSVR